MLQQTGLLEGQQQLLSNHGKLLEAFDTRLDRQTTLAETLAGSAQQFGQSSERLSATVATFQGISGSLGVLSPTIGNQVQAMAATVTTTRDLVQTFATRLSQHTSHLENLEEQVARLFGTTAKGVGDLGAQLDRYLAQYNERTGTQLGEYLGQIETKLGQAVSRLTTSIGDLDDHLDSLNDILGAGRRTGVLMPPPSGCAS